MEKSDNLTWRKRVKIAMIEQDVSLDDLSRLVGRSKNYTANVANGRINSPPTIRLIADALNIPWGDEGSDEVGANEEGTNEEGASEGSTNNEGENFEVLEG